MASFITIIPDNFHRFKFLFRVLRVAFVRPSQSRYKGTFIVLKGFLTIPRWFRIFSIICLVCLPDLFNWLSFPDKFRGMAFWKRSVWSKDTASSSLKTLAMPTMPSTTWTENRSADVASKSSWPKEIETPGGKGIDTVSPLIWRSSCCYLLEREGFYVLPVVSNNWSKYLRCNLERY